MREEIDYRIVIVGIVCLTILEIVALMRGINGVLLTSIIAIVAAAIGVAIPRRFIKS